MKRMLSYMMLVVAMSLAVSCGSIMDSGKCPDLPNGGRALFFRLDVGEGMAPTKADATWGDPYNAEIGNVFENRIMPDDLHVLVYKSDNTLVGPVDNLVWWPVDASQTEYEFMGEITDLELNTTDTYKVVVFANCGEPDASASLAAADGPGTMYFNVSDLDSQAAGSCIPMWGLLSTKFTLAERQELGEVDLLRAAAKIRIRLSDSVLAEGYEIGSASMNSYNEVGYSLPHGWTTSADTKALYQEGCFRAYASGKTSPLAFVVNADSDEAIFYMPEMDSDGVTDPISLTIIDANGNPRTYPIQLKEYVCGAAGDVAMDVVRNHIYEYVVTQVKSGGTEVVLTCEVQPWDYVSEVVEFSNNVTVEPGNEISWVEGYRSLDTSDHEVVLANNGTRAVCRFKISTPLGAEWFASIVTESGVYGAFAFDGPSSGMVGDDAELKIYAVESSPIVVSTARLRIMVRTADGTTIVVKTLVNSGGDEYTLIQNI